MSHKTFIQEFQKKLPKLLQKKADEIYEDILLKLDEGLKSDGIEFRGYFSIKAKTRKVRNTFKIKLFMLQSPSEPE